jgi:DNA mismatch repair protein MLH1
LNEDEVIAAIGDAIQERLAGANSSRVFLTQTLLPGAKPIEINTNRAESSIKKSESFNHDESEDLKPNEEIAQIIVDQLIARKEMLLEYFSITITEKGELATLPLMLKGYAPNLDKLPTFLLRLGTEVDWETEIGCFETLSREFGLFYAPEPPNFSNTSTSVSNKQDGNSMDICDTNVNKDNSSKGKSSEKVTNLIFTDQQKKAEIARYKWQIEHLIFPTLKSQFVAPKSITENGHVLQIANLPDLYRIFERC